MEELILEELIKLNSNIDIMILLLGIIIGVLIGSIFWNVLKGMSK